MNPDELKRGMACIINEMDRPCLGLVCLFDKFKNGIFYFEYLTDEAIMKTCYTEYHETVTKLTDFGYDVEIKDNEVYLIDLKMESIATYKKDGIPRKWQGYNDPDIRLLAKNRKLKALIECFNKLKG